MEVLSWEQERIHAFWDREVKLDDWREGFFDGHSSYFPQTISNMQARLTLYFLNDNKKFMNRWVGLRQKLPNNISRQKITYDLFWSAIVTREYDMYSWFLRPLPEWFALSNKEKQVLLFICKRLVLTFNEIHEYLKYDELKIILDKLLSLGFIQYHDIKGKYYYAPKAKLVN